MNTQPGASSLVTIWKQQQQAIMILGQTLHDRLPLGEPPVTIHGRELDQRSEGTGFQFQLTMNGQLYGGRFQAAYFVVQVQLVKRKAGLGWQVDAMPILEIEHSNYDLYPKRSHQFAYRDRPGLEDHVLDHLGRDAALFFDNVRQEQAPAEPATPYGGDRTSPVL